MPRQVVAGDLPGGTDPAGTRLTAPEQPDRSPDFSLRRRRPGNCFVSDVKWPVSRNRAIGSLDPGDVATLVSGGLARAPAMPTGDNFNLLFTRDGFAVTFHGQRIGTISRRYRPANGHVVNPRP